MRAAGRPATEVVEVAGGWATDGFRFDPWIMDRAERDVRLGLAMVPALPARGAPGSF